MNKIILKSIFVIVALLTIAAGSTNAYFSDSKVITGNVFSTGTWDTPKARMVINEVYYLGDEEWIELYNAGDATADIKGWSICNGTGSCGKLNPEKKTDVAPGAFVLVSHNQINKKDWELSKDVTEINYAGGKIVFEDTGDAVILKNTENAPIDQMSYGSGPNDCPLVGEGYSLQRDPVGKDTGNKTDFIALIKPNPGTQ